MLPYNIRENYVFLCEQYHKDESVSIESLFVARGYINAANIWGSGSHCNHSLQHNEVNEIK